MDAREVKLQGGFDVIRDHLARHDCVAPDVHRHNITHLISGTSSQIESAAQMIDQAAKAHNCLYTFLEDPERGATERRAEAVVTGTINSLKAYIVQLKEILHGSRS